MIQLTLDPEITELSPAPSKRWPSEDQRLQLLAHRLGQPAVIHLTEDDWMDAIELKADGPVQFSMSRSLVLNEPRYSNARAIWHHHANHVSVSQRIEIIDHLVENGGDLVIDEIARTQTDRAQAFAAVLRLVCDTYLTIDLNRPMLGTSRVRLSQLIREDLDHTDVTS